jgi:uncharacterized membrane protein
MTVRPKHLIITGSIMLLIAFLYTLGVTEQEAQTGQEVGSNALVGLLWLLGPILVVWGFVWSLVRRRRHSQQTAS